MILKYTLIVLLAITLPSSIETIEPKNDNSQTMSFPKLSSLSNLLKTSGSGTQPGFTITENDIPQDVRDAWNDIHHWLSTPASEIDQAIQHVLAYIPFFQDKLKSLQEKNNQILSKIDIFLKNFRNIKLPDININQAVMGSAGILYFLLFIIKFSINNPTVNLLLALRLGHQISIMDPEGISKFNYALSINNKVIPFENIGIYETRAILWIAVIGIFGLISEVIFQKILGENLEQIEAELEKSSK